MQYVVIRRAEATVLRWVLQRPRPLRPHLLKAFSTAPTSNLTLHDAHRWDSLLLGQLVDEADVQLQVLSQLVGSAEAVGCPLPMRSVRRGPVTSAMRSSATSACMMAAFWKDWMIYMGASGSCAVRGPSTAPAYHRGGRLVASRGCYRPS